MQAILNVISDIPSTSESEASDPVPRARSVASNAALKASIMSGPLALPPGPAEIITILPDLVAVWKIQAQMVADIAGAFGKQATSLLHFGLPNNDEA